VSTVGAGYFDVLGVRPRIGRFFGAGAAVERDVAVLSHGVWTSSFGASSTAVGATVELPEGRYTVVGVAPQGFTGPHLAAVDVWVPVVPENAGNRNWQVVGRLAPDRQGEAGRAAGAAEAEAVHGRTDPGRSFQWARAGTVVARPLSSDDAGESSTETEVARLLAAVMALVLLIACANVINLMLARLTRRRQELAVRLALGVGRWRLLRLLLLESLVVAVWAGLCSLPLAYAAGVALRRTLLPQVAWTTSPLDARVLWVTALVTLASGVLVALLPARFADRTDLARGLRAGARGGGARVRLHAALATAQVALAAVLRGSS
jgi:hypothetical protein